MKIFRLTVIFVIVLVVAAAAVFLYLARPVKAPSGEGAPARIETDVETAVVYRLVSSEAEFRIDEVLRGEPSTVMGTTGDVRGTIAVNMENPSGSPLGMVRVNARTLRTDSQGRDGAIARFILHSEDDANEFITFSPLSVSGLPDTIVPGTAYPFQVRGELVITGVTKEVTFSGDITFTGSGFSGVARARVLRSDFGLTIPDIPFVANVDDEVLLKISFVGERGQ